VLLDWQRNGLIRPAVVVAATKDYFAAQDRFGVWAAECCVMDAKAAETPSNLLANFMAWADSVGEKRYHRTSFKECIEQREGLRYKEVKGRTLVEGIRLKSRSDAKY
jgi:putative DNA primase/helicase